ncbi:hypothetical protein HDU76_000424, partial [Blyttiomyces sp. JEL0837]
MFSLKPPEKLEAWLQMVAARNINHDFSDCLHDDIKFAESMESLYLAIVSLSKDLESSRSTGMEFHQNLISCSNKNFGCPHSGPQTTMDQHLTFCAFGQVKDLVLLTGAHMGAVQTVIG